MIYQWKTPSLYKIPADVVGKEVELCRNADGVVKPAAVVDRASVPDNPLHCCFEWDDDMAAVKWREQEARVLISNLVTVIRTETNDAPPVVVRAFINVPGEDGRGYKNIVTVLKCASDREYMLSRALGELQSFKVKYSTFSELASVFKAIDEVSGYGG